MSDVQVSGLPRPPGVIEVDTVLDIGPGLRPMGWYKPKRHICVEPYGPYADRLEAAGYEVLRATALRALEAYYDYPDAVDAIYMFDVIEHMTREEGEEVLAFAKAINPAQIIVATPEGFMKQDHDAWGLGGEHWQTHRSGWLPSDFPGWAISYYGICHGQRGFIAISP